MINVYAVTSDLRMAPDLHAVDGSRTEILSHHGLMAVTSRHALPPVANREAILAHAHICDELLQLADAVLPVRFGSAYDHEDMVRAVLRERYDDLIAAVEHVRGRVEVGLRVLWHAKDFTPDTDQRAGFGRAYLIARVEQERKRRAYEERAHAVAADVHETLAALAADSRQKVLATTGLVLSAAYLIERPDLDRIVGIVNALATGHPELDLLCTGPWPPYNFAERSMAHA